MSRKLHCSQKKWARIATSAAVEGGLDPVRFLAGYSDAPHALVRWGLWRTLASSGFSYASIGLACGFHHTTVRHACITDRAPRQWTCRPGGAPRGKPFTSAPVIAQDEVVRAI